MTTRLTDEASERDSAQPEPLRNHPVVLSLPMILTFVTVGMAFPFLPLYFRSIGLENSQIAILLAVPALVTLFVNQLWGYVADVVLNRRVVMMLLSLAGAVVIGIYPSYQSFAAVVVLQALWSAFSRPVMPMVNSMIFASQNATRRFGPIRTTGSLAFIFSSQIAGFLIDRPDGPGIRIIFPLLVITNLLMALSIMPVSDHAIGHLRRSRTQKAESFWVTQRRILSNRTLRVFLLFLFVTEIMHGIPLSFQSVLIEEIGGKASHVALAINIGAAFECSIFFFGGWLLERIRLMPLFLTVVVAQVIRWSLVFFSESVEVVCVSNVLHMFTFGLMFLCSTMLIDREVPARYKSSGQTLLAIVYMSLSYLLGSAISALFLRGGASVQPLFGLAALITLGSIPFWVMMKRRYEAEHGISGIWIPSSQRGGDSQVSRR